jgi:hypothetical protein
MSENDGGEGAFGSGVEESQKDQIPQGAAIRTARKWLSLGIILFAVFFAIALLLVILVLNMDGVREARGAHAVIVDQLSGPPRLHLPGEGEQ